MGCDGCRGGGGGQGYCRSDKARLAPIHVDALTPVALGVGTALLMVGFWMLAGTRAPDAPRAFAAAERGSLIVATGRPWWRWSGSPTCSRSFAVKTLPGNINAGLWSRENVVVLDVDVSQDLPLLLKNQIKVSWAPLGSDPTAKLMFLRYECSRELAIHNDRWVSVPAHGLPPPDSP